MATPQPKQEMKLKSIWDFEIVDRKVISVTSAGELVLYEGFYQKEAADIYRGGVELKQKVKHIYRKRLARYIFTEKEKKEPGIIQKLLDILPAEIKACAEYVLLSKPIPYETYLLARTTFPNYFEKK